MVQLFEPSHAPSINLEGNFVATRMSGSKVREDFPVCSCKDEDFKGNKSAVAKFRAEKNKKKWQTVNGESERGSWRAAELV